MAPELEEKIEKTEEIEIIEDPEADAKVRMANRLAELTKEKKKAIDTLTVTINGVEYQGDDLSQARMTSALAIANWQFNMHLGQELAKLAQNQALPHEAQQLIGAIAQVANGTYDAVYKQNKIDWKGADGKLHNVMVESVGEALFTTMRKVGSVISQITKGLLSN